MKTYAIWFTFAAILLLISEPSFAQLTGTKTINSTLPPGGGNYISFTAAITDLDTSGVGTGGVTFNVAAGQTFTENPPEITATGTASNQIIFQKNGAGSNPKIIPSTPGTVASSTTLGNHGDGIVIINGGDYITFNGVDLQTDSTFTGVGMMEYGYYLKKASGTDASKNITIRNCSITLNKAAIYSFGIFVSNISGTTSVTVTSTDGRSENIKLYNTTIANCYGGVQLRGFAATAPFDFYDQAIDVGVDGANSITNYGGGASTAYGVYAIYQNNLRLAHNTINGGAGTTTTLYGVFTSTGTNSNVDIYNNTVTITGGGTTSAIYAINNAMGSTGTSNTVNMYNNTVTGCSYPTATTGVMYLLYSTATSSKINMYGNTITGNSSPGTGAMYCLYESGSVVDSAIIYGNTISNNARSSTGPLYCLYSNPTTTTNTEIFGNTVNDNTTAGGSVYSIYSAAGSTVNIYRNSVFNQSTTAGTTPVVYGLYITAGTSTRAFNNFVSDLRATVSTNANAIAGIYISGGTTVGAYYNSVFLNAASTSATTFGTSGIYASTTPTVDLRNNVVVNLSTPGPTGGATVAYRRSSAILTTYANESNNNDFYVNTGAGVQRYFYAEGAGGGVTNPDSTIVEYKSRVAPRDASSFAENAPFLNITTPPYNLHINPATPTQLESGGTPITTPIPITQDFDGNTRNASTPDVGADEFTGTGADLTPPAIVYAPLGHTTAGTVQILTALISDPSGVPRTGIGRPVAYWKINSAGTYTGATGTFVSGNNFSFSFGAGTVTHDTVYYFVAAQDSVNNVGVVPSQGASGFTPNPPAASTPPTNPSYYVARPVIAAGIYTVGTTLGQFHSLKAAFDSVNQSIVAGSVTLSMLNEGTNEPGQAVLQPVSYASGPAPIIIKPASGAHPTISGSAGRFIIKLEGADNVTIDGSNSTGGTTRDLTLRNDITSTNAGAIWVSSLGVNAGAENNTIKNCILVGGRNDTTNIFGVYAAGDTITSNGTGAHNNNLVIQNNDIRRARFGVFSHGVATTGMQSGLIIQDNLMGSDSAGFEISYRGIDLANTDGAIISGNRIFNMLQPLAFTVTAIHLDVNVSNPVISRNSIQRLRQTNTGSFGAQGISINSATGSTNVTIVNNMISDLVCDGGGTSTVSNPYGIRIAGGTNHKIYYNSVSLSGSFFNATTSDLSAAFIVTVSTATGLDIRNNIFSNTMAGGAGTKCYGIYAVSASTVFGTINRNDYYAGGPNGVLGRQGTTDVLDLVAWRTFTGQDSNSVSGDPLFFNAATNLHIDSTQASVASNSGAAISGITTDIDGQVRHAVTPDIGADEFVIPAQGWTVQTSGTTRWLNTVKAVSQQVAWTAGRDTAVLRTTNGGSNWQSVGQTPIFRDVLCVEALNKDTAFVTTTPGATLIYRTTNGGATWSQVWSDVSGFTSIRGMKMYDVNNGFAVGNPYPSGTFVVLRTTDGGQSWSRIPNEPTPTGGEQVYPNAMSMVGSSNIWFGGTSGRVYRSTNGGTTWSSSLTTITQEVRAVHFNDAFYGVAAGFLGASRSTDGGVTWISIPSMSGLAQVVSGVGTEFWESGDGGTFRSSDRGATWTSFPIGGIGSIGHMSFVSRGGTVLGWAVSYIGGIARYFGGVTEVRETPTPSTFILEQNYPNPFNPTTTLRYGLSKDARVSLSIYNILGQRVATLKDEVQSVGYHTVIWNGRNNFGTQIASGVYFYRIEARPVDGGDAFSSIKKMLMLK